MKFNEKIVRLRKTKGMTQQDLAKAVNVSRQAVYKWECGQSYPEVVKLIEIKQLFGISIDDLLDESYEVAAPEKKRRKRVAKPDTAPAITESNDVAEPIEEPAVVDTKDEHPVDENKDSQIETVSTPENTSPVSEEPKKEAKKRGFFARLFGRK
jgi:transcriptional regulator with XRE-family HTH domain